MAAGHGYHLGPSPNWYCSHISDTNSTGLLAYGARHEVVIIKASADPPSYELIQNVHTDRVTSVAFSKTSSNLLASGSDDCFVRIWNVKISENEEYSLSQEKEFKFDQKVSCVTWQHDENKTVFAAEGQMNVWVWDIKQEPKLMKSGVRIQPLVLSSCPHKSEHLAVGYKGGILAILDVSKNGLVVMKLKGHDDDIISLSWSPKMSLKVSDSLDLASTSRDKSLKVWNLESERYLHNVRIPQVQSHGKSPSDSNNKNRLWITCLWVPGSANRIMCTTISGDVNQVELSSEKKPFWTPVDTKEAGGHNRCIFNLSMCDNTLCSVSLDRQVVFYSLKDMKSTYALSTLGGFAQCITFSPIDVGRLAIGCGDKTVRIWRTSSNASPYFATMLWQGINGKVTALAWHPEKENQLAFGTDEGHVGTLDASGCKPPVIYKTYHRHIVYTLCWGPFKKGSASNSFFLYSCGDGTILTHDPSHHEKEAVKLDNCVSPKSVSKKSELAWKQDYSALAIGCVDGAIEIYSNELVLLTVLKVQKQLIQCLRWHPISTSVNPVSNFQHHLASSSYDTIIHVYDLANILCGEKSTESQSVTESSIQLVGHSNRVSSLSWSPHIDGELVSGSYDGSVQIWNAINMEPIGNYRGHRGLVMCVQWSTTNPEIIFSGGDDLSVQQFSTSSLVHKIPPPKKSKKSKKSAKQTDHPGEIVQESETAENVCNGDINEVRKDTAVTVPSTATSAPSKKKKKKPSAAYKSGFPLCNSLDARGKDGVLADIKTIAAEVKSIRNPAKAVQVDLEESPNLGFFLRPMDFKKTQAREENGHRENSNSELLFQFSLWRGDVEGLLKEAASLGQLSDYLLSLAPLGCRALWLEMCHKYALQLEKEENYTKAANYYLACHKIYEAVDMLVKHQFFREALAIAKGRFPESDPIFECIYRAWASKAEKDGNFELVAKCHLALGEVENAAKSLTRRNDGQSHAVAAYITGLNHIMPDTESCVISCIHQALTRNEWDVAKTMIEEQTHLHVVKNLKTLSFVVNIHQVLTESLKVAQTECNSQPLQHILECRPGRVVLWNGKLMEGRKTFLSHLDSEVDAIDKLELKGSQELLQQLSGQRSLSSREIIYETAIGLAQYLLADENDSGLVYFSKVLGTNYSAEPEYTILNVLCMLLFPVELSIPECGRGDSDKLKESLEDILKEFIWPLSNSNSKSKQCSAEASILGFFAANLLECLVQEACKLPKPNFLKHQDDCKGCVTVMNDLTCVFDTLSSFLKQPDFLKHETLSVKLRKLDENIAKLSAPSRGGGDNSSKVEELQRQKKDIAFQLGHLPEKAQQLPYPRNTSVIAKGKELCKQLALSVHCSKTATELKSLVDKFSNV